jgi:hypothetical protein
MSEDSDWQELMMAFFVIRIFTFLAIILLAMASCKIGMDAHESSNFENARPSEQNVIED